MSFASKHNHEPRFNIDTKDFPYVNLLMEYIRTALPL